MSDIIKHYPHFKKIVVKFVVYIRVSTSGQVYNEEGIRFEDGTLAIQSRSGVKKVESFCKEHSLKYEIVEIIEDAGKSGFSAEREGIRKLREYAAKGLVNVIVAKEPDRLFRNTKEYLIFKDYLDSLGVKLLFVDANFTNDSTGRVFETLTASMAEFYRNLISEKVSRNSNVRLVEDGKINGAAPILGLVPDESRSGHYVICSKEVIVLEKVLEIYILCQSEREAIEVCHNQGLRDQGCKNFSKFRFKNMLRNLEWRYSGKWYDNKYGDTQQVSLPHGPVISENLISRAINKRESHIKRNSRCGANKNKYLLSGLLFTESGCRLHGRPGNKAGKTYLYYTSDNINFTISAELLERMVTRRIHSYIKKSDKIINIIKRNNHLNDVKKGLRSEISTLGRRKSKIEGKIETLITRLSSLDLNESALEVLNKSINRLSSEKEELVDSINEKRNSLKSLHLKSDTSEIEEKLKRYTKGFDKLPFIERKEITFDIFEKIIVLDCYSVKLILKPEESGLFEIIQYQTPKAYENSKRVLSLYQSKGWSLRKIAEELNCSRHSIKKALMKEGVEISKGSQEKDKKLIAKIEGYRIKGDSYQNIADKLNLLKVSTLSGKGKWHPKTVRELLTK